MCIRDSFVTATRFWLVAIETRSSGSHIRASDRARISVRSAGTALPAAPHRSAVRWPPVTSLHQLYCSLTAGGCRTGGTMRAQYHAVPTITANNRSNSYHIRYLPAVLTHLSQPESFYPSQKGGNERHSPTCIILYISSKVLGSARPSRPT